MKALTTVVLSIACLFIAGCSDEAPKPSPESTESAGAPDRRNDENAALPSVSDPEPEAEPIRQQSVGETEQREAQNNPERRRGGRQEVALTDLPEEVSSLYSEFLKDHPDYELQELMHKEKRGRMVYEFEGEVDGKHMEIEVTEEGEVVEFEREVELADVPEDVNATLESYLIEHAGGGDVGVQRIEAETEDGVTRYEFELEGENGRSRIDLEPADGGGYEIRERGRRGGDRGPEPSPEVEGLP